MAKNKRMINNVPLSDRGLQYGDGCFTTILVEDGQAKAWELHLQRLRWGLDSLAIDVDNIAEIKSSIDMAAKACQHGIVKLIITRGSGGRGYSPSKESQPHWWVTTHQIPTHYLDPAWRAAGVSLGLSHVNLARQPLLAGFKHLNRLEQVLVKQDIEKHQWQDAVVLDTEQKVVETSNGNLFWTKNGEFFTPDLSFCGIKGIARCQLIRKLQSQGHRVHRVSVKVDSVKSADTVIMCNSIMGIVHVTSVDGVRLRNSDLEKFEVALDEA